MVFFMEGRFNFTQLQFGASQGNFSAQDKVGRGKNAKQLTWVLLLKAHRAAGCVAWLAQGLWSLLAAVKRRIYLDKRSSSRFYSTGRAKSRFYSNRIIILIFFELNERPNFLN